MTSSVKRKHKTVYWVEKISALDIVCFLVKRCCTDIRVHYDRYNYTPAFGAIFAFLCRIGLQRIFIPVNLVLHRLDARGYSLTYRVHDELNACIEGFFKTHIPQESQRFKNMLKANLAVILKPGVIFVTMVDAEINAAGPASGDRNIIVVSSHPFNYLLCLFYRNRVFSVRRARFSMQSIAFYLRPFCYLSLALASKCGRPQAASNISTIRPAIWLEYYPGRWHSFWVDSIRSKDFDIVKYFDRADTPLTQKATEETEAAGIKWIDLHLISLIRIGDMSFPLLLRLLAEACEHYVASPVWLGIFRFECTFLRSLYAAVFSRYQVKVLIQHQEASWRQEIQAQAMEIAGGIMVGYHWSIYQYYLTPTHFFPQHVFFAWGRIMSAMLRADNSACRYVLPSGIWIVHDGDVLSRGDLFADQVSFVMSVFDDSVKYNLYQSPQSLSDFYLRILTIVENNERFGCIIKSKHRHELLSSLPQGNKIAEKIELLKGKKRLVILDSSSYPLVAGACSDLSVGYSINSACALVGTIGGRAAVNWDCAGLKSHPFHKHPERKIVFDTLNELEEAIVMVSAGDGSIGDYRYWKKDVNYFDDRLAVGRITGFLESYMAESMMSGDPEHALCFAVHKYIDDNKVGQDFFERSDMWKDARRNT